MHLIVLRRNNIPIPTVLPTYLAQLLLPDRNKTGAVEGDLLHLEDDDNNIDSKKLTKASSTASFSKQPTSPLKRPPPIPLQSTDSISSPVDQNSPMRPKEWTKFPESPTSNMSSPGPKPVNFDIQRTAQAVVSDPKILHPVALRVTPEVVEEEPSRRKTTESGLIYEAGGVIIRETTNSSPKIYTSQQPQQRDSISIQRPQPKKVSSKGTIPPPPQRESSNDVSTTITNSTPVNISLTSLPSKKEPPPLPPPRGHTRSSSLDLKKLKMGNETTVTQPQLQPMSSYDGYIETPPVNDTFADFAHFPEPGGGGSDMGPIDYVTTINVDSNVLNSSTLVNTSTITNHAVSSTLTNNRMTTSVPPIPQPHPRSTGGLSSIGTRTSAFEVYRRQPSFNLTCNSQSPNDAVLPLSTSLVPNNTLDYEKRVILISDNLRLIRIRPGETMNDVLKHLKEQNHLLLKLCNDLSEELLNVQTKKENIRLHLDATVITNNNHTNQ